MSLRLHDQRRGGIHEFLPVGEGPVGLYVCGITPYDSGHLGHAATYVAFDVLNRYLRFLGHRVTYVQNLTDVDDDMLRKAAQLGEDYLALGQRNVQSFFHEMAALNWLPPDRYPRATQHIEPMQRLIGRLLERGHAYLGGGNVFYEVDSFPAYGALSRLGRDEMLPLANERGNVPEMAGKRDPLDFVLWQRSAPGEPSWPSPWGPGRPGWHVECSAMSMEYLGDSFEIHGGGSDLIFPHHESEIAQSEAATGRRPFAHFWMHTGMVHHDDEKMSKSLGNLVLVRDLLQEHPAAAIRRYLVSHHYREDFAFNERDLAAAARATERLRAAVSAGDGGTSPTPRLSELLPARVAALRRRFVDAMDSDLDTPAALAALDELAALATDEAHDQGERAEAGALVRDLAESVLGITLAAPRASEAVEAASVPIRPA